MNPRRFPRFVALTAAAGIAAAAITALVGGNAATAAGPDATAGREEPKPTVVLVHGAFADATGSWSQVAKRLQDRGYRVVAPANPLRGLPTDSAYLSSVLDSIDGPIVLAGHSYGGAVITNAAAGNPAVKALVYVAAFAPDKGETLGALSEKFPGSQIQTALRPVPYQLPDGTGGADLYLQPDKLREVFAPDVPERTADLMAAAQRPLSASAFADTTADAAWRTIPSWFLVATQDKVIPADLQRFEAVRADARGTTEVRSSHVPMISNPDATTDLIVKAARAAG
ncbi:alpha/beta fold hydrolase [Catellatospora coxensis]|nr:alpha/beta hydrolase [Catellatospora coxensis]